MMASKFGGMEIEEVAAKDPAAVVREPLDPGVGMFPFQARKLAFAVGLWTGGAGRTWRLALFVPLWVAGLGLFQAREHT